MPVYDKKTKRYYLNKGDKVEASPVTLEYRGGDYKLFDIMDAELEYWDEETEQHHRIKYAWDLPRKNSRHSVPYFEK